MDLSNNNNAQGAIDFKAIRAAGYTYVWLKVTEGLTFFDPDFTANYQAARAAGLEVRVYHFAHIDVNDPIAEAQWCLAHVPADVTKVALDQEVGSGNLFLPVRAWLDYTQQTKEAHLYTDLYYIQQCGLNDPYLAKFPLWLAYPEGNVPPAPPYPWTSLNEWQRNWWASVPGVVGLVDQDEQLTA